VSLVLNPSPLHLHHFCPDRFRPLDLPVPEGGGGERVVLVRRLRRRSAVDRHFLPVLHVLLRPLRDQAVYLAPPAAGTRQEEVNESGAPSQSPLFSLLHRPPPLCRGFLEQLTVQHRVSFGHFDAPAAHHRRRRLQQLVEDGTV